MIREYVVKVTDALVPDEFQRFESELAPEQELIRCKDCKWFHPGDGCWNKRLNDQQDIATLGPDWFCADGKRRDDNG